MSVATFGLFILFQVLELAFSGSWAIGWFWYLGFATILTSLRISIRSKFDINGNVSEDFFCSLIFYPCCALQMDLTTAELEGQVDDKKNKDPENIKMKENGNKTAPDANGKENAAYVSQDD